jgi:hypothetical protein
LKAITAVLYLSFATTGEISDDECRGLIMENLGKDAKRLALNYDVTYVCTIATATERMRKISIDNQKNLKREKINHQRLGKKTFERCGDNFCETTDLPVDYNIQLE